jgi:hypothetical protein
MVVAADYPLLNIIWTMFVFFGFVLWIWAIFMVFGDLFRRHDISGWGKAAWCLFVIFLPLLGVLTYLIVHGKDMAERRAQDIETTQAQFDDHIRTVASSGGGSAAEIKQAKDLLDSGAITQAEFDQIKQKALAANGGTRPTVATG